jgi:serine/threonine protein kinase
VKDLPKGYELVRTLGAGGFGEVVLARQVSLDRMVAVKRIHAHALTSPDALERFQREGRVLAGLSHPCIVKVFDFLRDGEDAMLVMEHVDGSSLADVEGPLSVEATLMALEDVADALAEAAGHGIAHRDVKPGNVFLLRDGHAKLGDFGLARVVSDPGMFRTADGASIGTPAYFPPETGQGLSEPDERSDAYSFAVMAYELLVGRLPYEDLPPLAMIAAHWLQEPPPPTALVPGFPLPASDALLQGLTKDPLRRPLPRELVARLRDVPANAWPAPAPRSRRAAPTRLVSGNAPAPTPLPRQPRRSWPLGLGIGALVATGALVGLLHSPPHLEVRDLVVTSGTTKGTCPSATFTFTAVVTTNDGSGSVTGRWTQPNGVQRAPVTVRVAKGTGRATTALAFTVTGQRPFQGRAEFRLIRPKALSAQSPQTTYNC